MSYFYQSQRQEGREGGRVIVQGTGNAVLAVLAVLCGAAAGGG
jgi:hypothetical protein